MLVSVDAQLGRELVVLWLLPVALAVAAIIATRRSQTPTRRAVVRAMQFLIAAYLVGVVVITLWPFEFDFETGRILDRGNWTPFGGTLGFLISDNSLKVRIGSRDFLANVLLFAPLGVLLTLQQKRMTGVVVVITFLIAIAFALEVIQGLTVAERTLDIDDAIAGSVGAALAAVAGLLLRPFAYRTHQGLL